MNAIETNDLELKRLVKTREKLLPRVASGDLTPLEALQRLHVIVDYSNQRWPGVRHWGRV